MGEPARGGTSFRWAPSRWSWPRRRSSRSTSGHSHLEGPQRRRRRHRIRRADQGRSPGRPRSPGNAPGRGGRRFGPRGSGHHAAGRRSDPALDRDRRVPGDRRRRGRPERLRPPRLERRRRGGGGGDLGRNLSTGIRAISPTCSAWRCSSCCSRSRWPGAGAGRRRGSSPSPSRRCSRIPASSRPTARSSSDGSSCRRSVLLRVTGRSTRGRRRCRWPWRSSWARRRSHSCSGSGSGFDPTMSWTSRSIREHFGGRAQPLIEWLNPTITLLAIAAGSVVAFLLRRGRSASVAARLGIPWLAFAGAGLLAPLLFAGLPGHRTLLLGVPAPMLGGLAIAGGAHLFAARERGDGSRTVLRVAAIAIAVSVALGVALLGTPAVRSTRERGATDGAERRVRRRRVSPFRRCARSRRDRVRPGERWWDQVPQGSTEHRASARAGGDLPPDRRRISGTNVGSSRDCRRVGAGPARRRSTPRRRGRGRPCDRYSTKTRSSSRSANGSERRAGGGSPIGS